MIITTEEDRKYLESLSELEREVALADCFEQFKKAAELRIALSIAQYLEVCANNSVSDVEQVHGCPMNWTSKIQTEIAL